MILSGLLTKIWDEGRDKNRAAIISLVGKDVGTLLDCGCDDGEYTMEVAVASGASRVMGLEIDKEQAGKASRRGVEVVIGDLNKRFPIDDGTCDVVVLNQVIEHIPDTDHLLGEIGRVLKPDGFAVISTENLSGWPNVISAALGWQPFSITNISSVRLGIGNPLAAHRGEKGLPGPWQHQRVMAPRALIEIVEANGLVVEEYRGIGYFPLTGRPADLLCRLDSRHTAFMTIRCRKPDNPGPGR